MSDDKKPGNAFAIPPVSCLADLKNGRIRQDHMRRRAAEEVRRCGGRLMPLATFANGAGLKS